MRDLLYLIAFFLILIWIIGFLGFQAGAIIHILLVIALICIIVRLVQGKKLL